MPESIAAWKKRRGVWGASESKTFTDVVLPQLRPTIFAGAVIALDEAHHGAGHDAHFVPTGLGHDAGVHLLLRVGRANRPRARRWAFILIIIVAIGTAMSNRLSGTEGGSRPVAEIRLKQVIKRFGQVTAVDKLNLEIRSGELISLLGPSGCGKTTGAAHAGRV